MRFWIRHLVISGFVVGERQQNTDLDEAIEWYYWEIHYPTREFLDKFHSENRYRMNREASAMSIFSSEI